MSQVRNVQLSVSEQANNRWEVTVTYEARFSSAEVSNELRFLERITLLGVDQVSNRFRPEFEELTRFDNGVRSTSRVQAMNRTFTVNGDVLDEDDGTDVAGSRIPELGIFLNPRDEVAAQVELIPIGISSGTARSAVISESF